MKFPLHLDEEIGFTAQAATNLKLNITDNLHDAVSNQSIMSNLRYLQSADEDYETDNDIMRKTIASCKKDVLIALKKTIDEPHAFFKSLYNNKYQRYFRRE